MLKDIRVAVIQAKVPMTKDEGEKQILRLVKEAVSEPVDIVGLPEDCVFPYKEIREGYKPLDFLSKVAKDNGVYLFGAIAVLEGDGLHNKGFLFDRTGRLVAKIKLSSHQLKTKKLLPGKPSKFSVRNLAKWRYLCVRILSTDTRLGFLIS